MSEEKLMGGKVNVEKYMALLQSESDLKIKLQQLFLKMKETETQDKAEIARLEELLSQQKLQPAEDKGDELKLKAELNAVKMELDTTNAKLSSCHRDRSDLQEQLEKADKQAQLDLVSPAKAPKAKTTNKTAKAKVTVTTKDDLTLINGVGPKLKEKLNNFGINSFAQIAAWKAADIRDFDDKLSFKGRIKRDAWVKQAKALAKK